MTYLCLSWNFRKTYHQKWLRCMLIINLKSAKCSQKQNRLRHCWQYTKSRIDNLFCHLNQQRKIVQNIHSEILFKIKQKKLRSLIGFDDKDLKRSTLFIKLNNPIKPEKIIILSAQKIDLLVSCDLEALLQYFCDFRMCICEININ